MESFAVVDGVFSPGAGDGGLRLLKLSERGERCFRREVVFARVHNLAAQRAAEIGNRGRGHEPHLGIVKNLSEGTGDPRARIFCREGGGFLRV